MQFFINVTGGDFSGFQDGLLNWPEGFMHGWQAGLFNYTKGGFAGVETGFLNFYRWLIGLFKDILTS